MLQDAEAFKQIIATSVAKFSEDSADVLHNVFAAQCKIETPEIVTEDLGGQHNLFVSILFTGVVYGEYILATDEKTAAALLNLKLDETTSGALSPARSEIADAFCEALNLIVGTSVVGLNHIYRKITITPPKVNFGMVGYPKVTAGRARLTTVHGPIDCYLFIDRMKLDIASSYQEALGSMMVAHKELHEAMVKLKAQQSTLVQTEKMAALGTMAAGVAHEINPPLQTLSLVSGQLRNLGTEPGMIKMVDTIDATVTRMSRITNSMRFFAKQAKQSEFTVQNVKSIMENVLIMGERQLEKVGVTLRYTPPPVDIEFECRASDISQLVLSLVQNACDAVESLPEKWVKIEWQDAGDTIELKVSDSGTGIPKGIREKIFDPFFTTKDFGRGSGLGLSLAHGVSLQHSGHIHLDTNANNTCFVIHLPKKQPAQAAA